MTLNAELVCFDLFWKQNNNLSVKLQTNLNYKLENHASNILTQYLLYTLFVLLKMYQQQATSKNNPFENRRMHNGVKSEKKIPTSKHFLHYIFSQFLAPLCTRRKEEYHTLSLLIFATEIILDHQRGRCIASQSTIFCFCFVLLICSVILPK